jgi:1-acyl-sn-glycerol-3-phosphate acyltransferase
MKPYSFTATEAVTALKEYLFGYLIKNNLNPQIPDEWRRGIFRLFGTQVINLPDFENENFVIAPNHISDFDAVVLGLLHPQIRIISKIGWAANEQLKGFLSLHYNIAGVYRDADINLLDGEGKKAAAEHNYRTVKDSLKYLKSQTPRHLLIFPQGTISDINRNSPERVNPGFAKIAAAANVRIVNAYTEYPDMQSPTRVIFGEPYKITDRAKDPRQSWLDGVISLQNKLDNLRTPIFSEKHRQNNNPSEPYFQ